MAKGKMEYNTLPDKLRRMAALACGMLCHVDRRRRRVRARGLSTLAGKSEFMYLAIRYGFPPPGGAQRPRHLLGVGRGRETDGAVYT